MNAETKAALCSAVLTLFVVILFAEPIFFGSFYSLVVLAALMLVVGIAGIAIGIYEFFHELFD